MITSDEVIIKVNDVGKTFKLPHEKTSSIKGLFVSMFRRKRTYEKQQVLKDISFEIKKGEFFGIVGRNGSGKSTLLKLLAGIYSPDSGLVQVNGKLTPFIELGVGFNPELTGRENVFLNGALLGFNRKEMEGMYDEIVKFAEIEKFMDQKLKNYSSGMQVRLAFSIAIRSKSDILLIDEVLAVGDEAFQQKCREYFLDIKNSDCTVVFVTHDMKAVTDYCDRAMLVSDGKIQMIRDPIVVAEAYDEINLARLGEAPQDLVASVDSIRNEARIKKVSLKDGKTGKPKTVFKYGEEITVDIVYELLKPISTNAVIDVGLQYGRGGPYYFYTTTEDHGLRIKKGSRKSVTLSLQIQNIFNGGIFNVATSLYDSKTLKVYARERSAATFKTGNLPGGGMVSPKHNLQLKETTQ